MVHKLDNVNLVEDLFDGWNETLIWSCLQKVMGQIYVTEFHEPKSAKAHVGCFSFFAGEPSEELVCHKENGFEIMIPENEKWATVACAALILECLEKEKYPSWDAQNMNSVHLAEKLGYEYSHEYPVYEVN